MIILFGICISSGVPGNFLNGEVQEFEETLKEYALSAMQNDWNSIKIDKVDEFHDYSDLNVNRAVMIVDTSGSMRDRNTYALKPTVMDRVYSLPFTSENLHAFILLDSSGRMLYEWSGKTPEGYRRFNDLDGQLLMKLLHLYRSHSSSRPSDSILNAVRFSRRKWMDKSCDIFVFGDEFPTSIQNFENSIRSLNEIMGEKSDFRLFLALAHDDNRSDFKAEDIESVLHPKIPFESFSDRFVLYGSFLSISFNGNLLLFDKHTGKN